MSPRSGVLRAEERLQSMNSGGMPGDFPIGSLESRAAARILLSRRVDTRKRITIALSFPRPGTDHTRENW